MHPPSVNVVADGRNGYIVRYQPIVGYPEDLRRFPIIDVDTEPHSRSVLAARREADAFADGVREGQVLAAAILKAITKATT